MQGKADIHIQAQPVSIAILQARQRTDNMKKLTIILWGLFLFIGLKGQTQTDNLVGKVSFVSSQNIYVRFKSCEGISVGDTLYITEGNSLVPALIVNSMSSVVCFSSVNESSFLIAFRIGIDFLT